MLPAVPGALQRIAELRAEDTLSKLLLLRALRLLDGMGQADPDHVPAAVVKAGGVPVLMQVRMW